MDDLHLYYGRRLAEARRRRPDDNSLLARLVRTAIYLRTRLVTPGSWLDRRLGALRARQARRPADLEFEIFLARAGPSARDLAHQRRVARSIGGVPLHLIEAPAGPMNAPRAPMVEALLRQSYPHWTWTQTADGVDSVDPDEAGPDQRFGAASSIVALPLAEVPGDDDDFIGLLPRGDAPTPDALFHFAQAASTGAPELIYADVDWLDDAGVRHDPLFKPDWSPATMLSTDLLTGLVVARRSLVRQVLEQGRPVSLRDLHFQLAEGASRIVHIPRILTHLPGDGRVAWSDGTANMGEATAVRDHLARLGLPRARVGVGLGGWPRVVWDSPDRQVTVVIPSRDQPEVLQRCLWSLAERTQPPPSEVVIVDTGSTDPRTEAIYRGSLLGDRLRVLRQPGEFNFARACNAGARSAAGDLILFLNNDTEALAPDWLERMAQWFALPGVGVVGAKLLYPDETIQHAGVVVGMGGLASHLFQGGPELEAGPFGSDQWYRDLSAVTAACMLVSRQAFERLEGFDESFRLNYQDVDFCLRARLAGWRVVYTPDARLLHHESHTHRRRIPRRDLELASERWLARGDLDGDPFFNPNLSYMSAMPIFNRGRHDHPRALNRRLMQRLPRKEILTLPDDLR